MKSDNMGDQIALGFSNETTFASDESIKKFDQNAQNMQETKTPEEGESKKKGCGLTSVLAEYSQNTNFHGFRYIFDAVTIFGRIAWLLIFLLASGVLFWQIKDRIETYQSRPVNVNIDVKRAPSLPFPAVVICNTNQYRMTIAEDRGVYFDLRHFFSSEEKQSMNDTTGLDDLDMHNLTLELSHQKEDFIYDCHWGTERCGPQNFSRLLTDFGVCFAFNDGLTSNRSLDVFATGEAFGLHLVLNLEQYEYMAGPLPSAGVKLLLYNESDFPRVRDFGLFIPPASNTLIGFKINKMSNLEPPYGTCGEKELKTYRRYAETSCEIECFTELAVQKCGCRDYYMRWDRKDDNTPPYCSLTEIMTCVAKLRGEPFPDCGCPLPCYETTFITSMSYSATSDFEASKKAFHINKERRDIVKKFRAGKVSQERLDDAKLEEDVNLINKIYQEALKMNDSISQGDENSTSSQFMHMLDTVETDVTDLMKKVKKGIENVKAQVDEEVNTFKDTMDYEATSYIMFDLENLLGREVNMLTTILTSIYSLSAGRNNAVFDKEVPMKDRMNNIRSSYMGKTDVLVDILETVQKIYQLVIDGKWNGTWGGKKVNLPTKLIYKYGNDTMKLLKKFSGTISGLKTKLTALKTCVYQIDVQIPAAKHQLTWQHHANIKVFSQSCKTKSETTEKFINTNITSLYKDYLNILKAPQGNLGEEIEQLNRLIGSLSIAITNMKTQVRKFREIQANSSVELPYTVQLINNASELVEMIPTWRNISKEITAWSYAGQNASIAVEKAKIEKKDFVNNLDLLISYIRDVENLEINVLDTLNLSIQARKTPWPEGATLRGLVKQMPVHIHKVRELKKQIDFIVFAEEYKNLVDSLDVFVESLQVKSTFYKDNFLTVSIYYQLLQYQGVTQQAGYTWFALLCDIGGTAGLFVGASLLTIVELLYFISVSAYDAMRSSASVKPAQEKTAC